MQRLGIALDELADRNVALGDPGALIEQPGGGEKRREIDLDALPAELLDFATALANSLSASRLPKNSSCVGARHADPAPRDCRQVRRGALSPGAEAIGASNFAARVEHRSRVRGR